MNPMNDQEDVNFEPEESMLQNNQAAGTALFFAVALGLGALATVLYIQNNRQETPRDHIEHMVNDRMDDGRDAVKRLEKEYANLRKKVEEALQR
jgi:hypothetical protein